MAHAPSHALLASSQQGDSTEAPNFPAPGWSPSKQQHTPFPKTQHMYLIAVSALEAAPFPLKAGERTSLPTLRVLHQPTAPLLRTARTTVYLPLLPFWQRHQPPCFMKFWLTAYGRRTRSRPNSKISSTYVRPLVPLLVIVFARKVLRRGLDQGDTARFARKQKTG